MHNYILRFYKKNLALVFLFFFTPFLFFFKYFRVIFRGNRPGTVRWFGRIIRRRRCNTGRRIQESGMNSSSVPKTPTPTLIVLSRCRQGTWEVSRNIVTIKGADEKDSSFEVKLEFGG